MAQDISKNRKPRRSFLVFSLALIFLLAAAGWSYAWMRARDKVTENLDRFLAREAQAGRLHQCANRQAGGYPFHIAISCQQSVVQFENAGLGFTASFSGVRTVAPVYAPTHVTTEFISPLQVKQGERLILQANFSQAEASFRHDLRSLERFSFEVENLRLAPSADSPAFGARDLEINLHPAAGNSEALQNYEFALEASGVLLPMSAPDQAMDASLTASLQNWPGFKQSVQESLDAWLHQNGTIALQDLRIKRNGGLLVVKGEAHLNEARRAEGRFEATFVNSPALLKGFLMQKENDAGALFGPLVQLLGRPVDFEGRRGSVLQIKMANGTVTLGSVVLAEVPPLY